MNRITKEQALDMGFTHHGSYFGIPLWITDTEQPLVSVKFDCMNYFFDMANIIEGFLSQLIWPERERVTTFNVGRKI